MHEQCVPGSLSSSLAQDPENKATENSDDYCYVTIPPHTTRLHPDPHPSMPTTTSYRRS